MYVIHLMDLKRLVWQHRLRCTVLLDRGGDPERFRDEARGLGRVALLVQFPAVPFFLKRHSLKDTQINGVRQRVR